VPRPEALCPVCGALERHRLVWLYMERRTDLLDGRAKRLLHLAPEKELERRLRAVRGLDYLSGDRCGAGVTVRLDVTALPFGDDSFDVICCSHVLEHVPDDLRAMAELFRVLRPGGWAILQSPVSGDATIESPPDCAPEERVRRFGQSDHVRRYGKDYADRLAAAGFRVRVDGYARELPRPQCRRFGLDPEEDVYLCGKA